VLGVGGALRFGGVVAAELAPRRERRGGISIAENAVSSEIDRVKSRREGDGRGESAFDRVWIT